MTASVVGYHEGTCERASLSQPQIPTLFALNLDTAIKVIL